MCQWRQWNTDSSLYDQTCQVTDCRLSSYETYKMLSLILQIMLRLHIWLWWCNGAPDCRSAVWHHWLTVWGVNVFVISSALKSQRTVTPSLCLSHVHFTPHLYRAASQIHSEWCHFLFLPNDPLLRNKASINVKIWWSYCDLWPVMCPQ